MKPKIGDRVTLTKEHISNCKADLLADLQDRCISGSLFDRATAALNDGTPLFIVAIQDDGTYELALSKRGRSFCTADEQDINT